MAGTIGLIEVIALGGVFPDKPDPKHNDQDAERDNIKAQGLVAFFSCVEALHHDAF